MSSCDGKLAGAEALNDAILGRQDECSEIRRLACKCYTEISNRLVIIDNAINAGSEGRVPATSGSSDTFSDSDANNSALACNLVIHLFANCVYLGSGGYHLDFARILAFPSRTSRSATISHVMAMRAFDVKHKVCGRYTTALCHRVSNMENSM